MNTALASTSITALSVGSSLPVNIRKALHPLIFTTVITIMATLLTERAKDALYRNREVRSMPARSWIDQLDAFIPSSGSGSSAAISTFYPGSFFAAFLGPSCTALAFRIISHQKAVGKHLPAVVGTSMSAVIASLFISPLVGRVCGLPAEMCGSLAHRSVTSPLHRSSGWDSLPTT